MSVEAHKRNAPAKLGFAVITVSDTRDEKSDRGGPLAVELIEAAGHAVRERAIVRDERAPIEAAVRAALARADVQFVVTTGGTGFAARDVTVPTLEGVFDAAIPGFGELFRAASQREIGAAAMLSRATAGVVGSKAVFALPGSPKAVRLALAELILPEAGHLAQQLGGGCPSGPGTAGAGPSAKSVG